MQKQDIQKHFLALMKRPGDFSFIPITKLDIADRYNYDGLMEIDSWTMKYTKDEILSSIKRANIVSNDYLDGTLVIQDNQKHNPLNVIDKDYYDGFKIDEFLNNSIKDKNRQNIIINKYNSLTEDNHEIFSMALKSGDITLVMDMIFALPYLDIRKFIIYLIELRNKDRKLEKSKELIRDKAA